MAKQGQHKNDGQGPRSGRRNPKEAVAITAGTPKKQETYDAQAREGEATNRQAQHSPPSESTRDTRRVDEDQKRGAERTNPRGGDSEYDNTTMTGPGSQHPPEYREDLNPNALAGENAGPDMRSGGDAPLTLGDVKEAHAWLREFTKAELRLVPIVREGERLEQGATYIDLHGSRREFTATGDMSAGPDHWYARKNDVDYVLWNRLIGVKEAARLDREG